VGDANSGLEGRIFDQSFLLALRLARQPLSLRFEGAHLARLVATVRGFGRLAEIGFPLGQLMGKQSVFPAPGIQGLTAQSMVFLLRHQTRFRIRRFFLDLDAL
jgi:hypothetical protein